MIRGFTSHQLSSSIEYSTDASNEALANDLYAPDSDLDRQQRDEEYEEAQDSAVKKGPGKGKTSRSKQEWIVQKRWNCSDYPLEEINSQVKHVVTSLYKVSETVTEAPIGKRIIISLLYMFLILFLFIFRSCIQQEALSTSSSSFRAAFPRSCPYCVFVYSLAL